MDGMTGPSTTASTPATPSHSDHATAEPRVVVGVDGSSCAERALEFAAHEAALRRALLHIVSAYQVPSSAGRVVAPLDPLEESAAECVDNALTRVRDLEPSVGTKGEQRHGFAGHVLVEISHGASLLVVGTRGRSELTGLLIGSVSEYCVHHASCPTVIVRGTP